MLAALTLTHFGRYRRSRRRPVLLSYARVSVGVGGYATAPAVEQGIAPGLAAAFGGRRAEDLVMRGAHLPDAWSIWRTRSRMG